MYFYRVKGIFRLLRVHQYVKNAFILLPLFFAAQFSNTAALVAGLTAFLAFSLTASAIYILNDLRDVEEDRLHPIKKHRPIASGEVPVSIARIAFALFAALGLGMMFFLNMYGGAILAGYFLMNIGYSAGLKHIPILDITIISLGFIFRLLIGGVVMDIPLSKWIILVTFLLALFLALAKRRDDVLLMINGKRVRKNIDGYNLEFINGAMVIMASVTIVSYIMYTLTPEVIARFGTDQLYMTVVFVILGIMRYMQITFVSQKSGSPTRILLTDLFLQIVIACWLFSFAFILSIAQ